MQVKSHYNLGFPLIMWTIRLKYLSFLSHAMMLNLTCSDTLHEIKKITSESFQMPMKYKMICAQVWNPMCFNKQINSAYTHLIILWDRKICIYLFPSNVIWQLFSHFRKMDPWRVLNYIKKKRCVICIHLLTASGSIQEDVFTREQRQLKYRAFHVNLVFLQRNKTFVSFFGLLDSEEID